MQSCTIVSIQVDGVLERKQMTEKNVKDKCKKSRYDQTKYYFIKTQIEDTVEPCQHHAMM